MIGTSTAIERAPRDVLCSVGTKLPSSSKTRLCPAHTQQREQHAAGPRYFVGTDQACTFRERIEEVYTDNREITDAVAELDEYFSDPAFEDRPGFRRFVRRVAGLTENPQMAREVAGEIVNQGYITALKRLGYRDAPLNVAFSRDFAQERGICFAEAFMFGPGGAARIAFADWLVEEKLHGMYRPGKAPGSSFSSQTRKIWRQAQSRNRRWPQAQTSNGESIPVEVSTEQGKLPEGVEQILRDSWRRRIHHGKNCAYTGMRPLRCGQNFQMIEDMVGALLDSESRPKLYCCPLDRKHQVRYGEIVERANMQGIDPFYAVYEDLFDNPDGLRPIWNKARRVLYEYSGFLRESAIRAGLVETPATTGITWHKKQKAWQAQIAVKGRQKYLGLFKDKADAQAAYDKAATQMGHIPGLPDINRIWPIWEQEKLRLARMKGRPQMPIVYQRQDTHEERKSGLRPPRALRGLVERMKRVDWLVRHCLLAFDDNRPAASHEIAIQSRGQRWCDQISRRGKRFVIQGCTSIDKNTGRIGITIYGPGFDDARVLAEEVYHVVFGIIGKADPRIHQAVRQWYKRLLRNGADPTVCLDEAFSKSMALEESGLTTSLPRSLVKQAQRMLTTTCKIPASVMDKVKAAWSMP